MKLLTKEIIDAMPPLYEQDGKGGEAVAYLKLFTPWGAWTWYATEGCAMLMDGSEAKLGERIMLFKEDNKLPVGVTDVLFFGYVEGFDKELGYFSLKELATIVGPGGLKVERDIHFKPTKLKDINPELFPKK